MATPYGDMKLVILNSGNGLRNVSKMFANWSGLDISTGIMLENQSSSLFDVIANNGEPSPFDRQVLMLISEKISCRYKTDMPIEKEIQIKSYRFLIKGSRFIEWTGGNNWKFYLKVVEHFINMHIHYLSMAWHWCLPCMMWYNQYYPLHFVLAD